MGFLASGGQKADNHLDTYLESTEDEASFQLLQVSLQGVTFHCGERL